MRIFTFVSTDPESPTRAIARIYCEMTGVKNKPAMEWHPTVFGSVTPEGAAQKAQEFWDAEVAKAKAVEDKKAAKALSKAAPAAPLPAEKEPVQAAAGTVEDPGEVI